MPRALVPVLSAAVAVAVPLILVGNAVWLLLDPRFVDLQYALPGFPVDPDGVQGAARTELAKTGVRSIRPGGEGIALLREARLPDGAPAFAPSEIRHMEDVRAVVTGVLAAWAIALLAGVAAGLALRRLAGGDALRRVLAAGSIATIVAMALIGLVMLVDFEAFFEAFHGVFFAEGTWQFADRFTLRQLYPDAFWGIAGATVAVLVLLQALALAALARARRAQTEAARA